MPCASPSWPIPAFVSHGVSHLHAVDTHTWSGCGHSLQLVPTVLISGSTVTSASRTGPRLWSATFPTSPSSGTPTQIRTRTLLWLRHRTMWTARPFSARWTGSAGSTERALGCLVLRFRSVLLVFGVTRGDISFLYSWFQRLFLWWPHRLLFHVYFLEKPVRYCFFDRV